MGMGYFGPKYSIYFIKGEYPGGNPGTRTLYQGSDKEEVSKKVGRCIERVGKFNPHKPGVKVGSQLSGFTLYYRGKPHIRVESVLGEDGVRRVVRS